MTEWLETNGLGGYASSTDTAMNTRRYHGLLVASLRPPVERTVLLSKLDETLITDAGAFELGVNQYPGAVHPRGDQYLREFRSFPRPEFTYEAGGARLTKRIAMVRGENTTVVEYHADRACVLDVRPLVAFRGFHALTHANPAFDARTDGVSLRPYPDLPTLYLHHGGETRASGHWYHRFQYAIERERGLDFEEDLFQPFVIRLVVRPGEPVRIVASIEARPSAPGPPPVSVFAKATDQFIVRRGALPTVIAGYPWFADWGRDTMIALPGLTLTMGRHDIARGILDQFAGFVSDGMLPNRFPDEGADPEYNTVDATLWFFEAARAYAEASGDEAFIRDRLLGPLREIIEWHVRGTRHGIRVDHDGLLRAGEPGVQLTWMDAKVDGWVVTPRHGKPVEIQALWYNALRVFETFARRFGDLGGAALAAGLAGHAAASFESAFWNEARGCLRDTADDGAVRPNQIIAVSLRHSMLGPARARSVVECVRAHLLTPAGLRTLARFEPGYHPRYEGGVRERDGAYHQGTVWPWLMGPFVSAHLRLHGDVGRDQCRRWLEPLIRRLRETGQLFEIADAEPPHQPRGCFAQAWSVAEVLRAWAEVNGGLD